MLHVKAAVIYESCSELPASVFNIIDYKIFLDIIFKGSKTTVNK